MQRNIIISGICLLYMWLTACTDPFAKEEFVAYDERPIGLYLEQLPEYSDFVKLLKIADLFNAVNISTIKYTCFVADNDAVQAYIQASDKWNSIEDVTEDEAKNLLKYHIIPSEYAYTALASGKLGTQTLSGDYLTVTFNENGSTRYINGEEVIKNQREEVELLNGYVHQLKSMLDPVIYTVMEKIDANSEYSIFAEALRATGLDSYLSRRTIEVNGQQIRDYKAVFVVPDSVYHRKGISDFQALRERFEGEPTDEKSEFYRYVGYHILKGAYDFSELTNFGDNQGGKSVETYIPREYVSLTEGTNDEIVINPNDTDSLYFIPMGYDIFGNNGFIHEVSGVMPISDPVRYGFTWEPTEWDEFKTIEFYQEPRVKNDGRHKGFWFSEPTEHVRWKTIPYKEEAVGYYNEDVDWDRFWHDDYLKTNLGQVGWVEFDTPTIMRGKYKITLIKWNWGAANKFQMYIDEVKFGPVVNMQGGSGGTAELGTYDFPDSGPHVFRFSVTGGNGELKIDRFIFTPVNE